jgi:ferredoxin, 2Fe-2S
MPQVSFIAADGTRTDIQADAGISLMQIALANGLSGINADCGGACQCATCHVYVEAPWISQIGAVDDTEDSMLDCTGEPRQAGSRLCCQVMLTSELDGMVVRLPAVQ